MRILIIHNKYQIAGGEDSVFSNEVALLSKHHDVFTYVVSNSKACGFLGKVFVALNTVFSLKQYLKIKKLIKSLKPDIVHVHNYFASITPSVFYACKSSRVPVVHTLHNFRAICPTATLSFNGKVTEQSLTKSSFWTIREKVYKDSYVGSFFLSIMVEIHKAIGTWSSVVDGYIALTDFSKEKYVKAGWPRNKIYVKPNFCSDKSVMEESREPFALYIGRFSEEKGFEFIVDSFSRNNINLKVAGEGPLVDLVLQNPSKNIDYLGCLTKDEVSYFMSRASCLVMGSTWYEGFPMVIVEAFSNRLPVVVPSLGNMAAVVEHNVNGLQYQPKNKDEFVQSVKRIISDKNVRSNLSKNARETYELNYTEDINYGQLVNIYCDVIKSSKGNARYG